MAEPDYKALYQDMKSRAEDRLDRLEDLEHRYEELRSRRSKEGCDECEDRREKAAAERDKAESDLKALRELVDRQAEDEGLWFVARNVNTAYVQQELRKLHAAIETAGKQALEGSDAS